MPSDMPWFRYYNETIHDKKLRFIAHQNKIPLMLVLGAWSCIEALASESTERGWLYASFRKRFTVTELADIMELEETQMQILLDQFVDRHMLELIEVNGEPVYHLEHWEERQFASDNSTERVRKWREAHPQEKKRGNETLLKRSRNGPESESDTESDEEEEKREVPPASPPEIQPGDSVSENTQAEKIWAMVTCMPTIPMGSRDGPKRDDVIHQILSLLQGRTTEEMVVYLKPFFDAWKDRDEYNRLNPGWLDWATGGKIPPPRYPDKQAPAGPVCDSCGGLNGQHKPGCRKRYVSGKYAQFVEH